MLVLVISYQMGVFDPLIDRLFYRTPASGNFREIMANINSSGRLEFWTYLLQEEEIKFFGNGLGYTIKIGKKRFAGLNLVHNDFLWVLYDLGIFGLATVILMLYYMYKKASAQEDRLLRRAFVSLMMGIPLVMLVDNFMLHIYIYFPLLFAYFTL